MAEGFDFPNGPGSGTSVVSDPAALKIAQNLNDVASKSTSRTNLGVAIGSDVQAYDDQLQAFSAVIPVAGSFPYWTNTNTMTVAVIGTAYQALQTNAGATAPQWGGYPVPTIGRPKISAGLAQYSIPWVVGGHGGGTVAPSANVDYYVPWLLTEPITITTIAFECTVAPATDGTFYAGIYAMDTDWQPTGNVLGTFSQAVTNAAGVAVYTASVSIALAPGRYVSAYNSSKTCTYRATRGGMFAMQTAMGGNAIGNYSIARTAATFTNTPSLWTAANAAGGQNTPLHVLHFGWTP